MPRRIIGKDRRRTTDKERDLPTAINRSGLFSTKTVAAVALTVSLTGCSLPVFFRVPVVQGNIVTAEQVEKLERGMTKKQVAYVLGTPLVSAPFETDRWDYVFYYRNPRAHVRQSELTVYFVNGKLAELTGEQEYEAAMLKMGDQPEGDDDAQLPGGTSSTGDVLGVGAIPGVPLPTGSSGANTQPDSLDSEGANDEADNAEYVPERAVPRNEQPNDMTRDGGAPPLPGQSGI